MEIEIEGRKAIIILVCILLLGSLLLFFFVGRAVGVKDRILTWELWGEMKARKRMEAEFKALCGIAKELGDELDAPLADPVKAERIYRKVEGRPKVFGIEAKRKALLEASYAYLQFTLGLSEDTRERVREIINGLGCNFNSGKQLQSTLGE